MKKQSFRQIFWKLAILAVLIGIAAYLMKDSLPSIMEQVLQTPLSTVLVLCVLGILYFVMEGASFWVLSRRYNKKFSWLKGALCAFYVNFFRIVTFGSGTVASNMVYLNREDIPPSESIGLVTIHNIFYQIAVVFWAFVGFFTQFNLMQSTFGDYFKYLLLGCAGAFLFISAMLLFALSARFHGLIMKIAHFLFRKKQWQAKLKEVDEMFHTARGETSKLLHDKKTLAALFVIHSLRMVCWYIIPVILFRPENFSQTAVIISLMAMVLAMAGVIPSPAGIGGLEFVYMTFFTVICGSIASASTLLLYRFATYILPLGLSVLVMIVSETKVKKANQ